MHTGFQDWSLRGTQPAEEAVGALTDSNRRSVLARIIAPFGLLFRLGSA